MSHRMTTAAAAAADRDLLFLPLNSSDQSQNHLELLWGLHTAQNQ